MKALDELYTKWPFYGSRRMLHELRELGHLVNRKRVQRLSRLMGLETIYPQKRPQFDGAQHRIFPYLESVPDALASLARYLRFYNDERKHQALGYRTPRSVYLDQAALN